MGMHNRPEWRNDEQKRITTAKQYALIAQIERPSELTEVSESAKHGPVPSKSALFMLRLMEETFDEQT
jgi:hypothetical protein